VADLAPPVADGVSHVADGPFRGDSLNRLIGQHRAAMLGRARVNGDRFPLLVKYLDAAENLSVQVHPTAAYAASHPGAHLKTEAWLVLHAEPGAAIYRGVHEHVSPERFRRAIDEGTVVELLQREAVSAGDCIPLESGLCHALGTGVLVAEVLKNRAQITPGQGVVGLEFNRPVVTQSSFFVVENFLLHESQVVMHFGRRLHSDGALNKQCAGSRIAQLLRDHAQHVQGMCILRFELKDLLVHLAGFAQRPAQVQVTAS
jgi:hypothetical protein